MRLRRRPRIDTLQNEIRARGKSWGRWIYLGLVCLFVVWIFDLFVGDLIFFNAEGLVMRDRVVLATQYPAAVDQLALQEGSRVQKGQVLLRVRSLSVEESLAKQYTGLVEGITQATRLKVRNKVIEATAPMAEQRYQEARAARIETEALKNRKLITIGRRADLIKNELESAEARTQAEAERKTIAENLPELEAAVQATKQAMARLKKSYNNGIINAPSSGIIGYLYVSNGSVVRQGQPLMELFTGQPFVLTYVPEGAIYDVAPGDRVNIKIGFSSYAGHVERVYPVAGQLPKEFQNTFQPVARARIARIAFEPSDHYPALFTKTTVTAAGWPPAWAKRLVKAVSPRSLRTFARRRDNRNRGEETQAAN